MNAKIAFGYAGDEEIDAGGHQLFADRWSLWWDTGGGTIEQGTLFPNYIDISEKLFEDLARSFPVDMKILQALKQSSLALDLYAFATAKVYGMKSTTAISWKAMHAQFSGDYSSIYDFRKKALKHLRVIRTLYPDFKYTLETRSHHHLAVTNLRYPHDEAGLARLSHQLRFQRLLAPGNRLRQSDGA